MKSEPIVPAVLERDADGTPFSSRFGDVYHPHAGPFEQARHVFLDGNGLPARWRDRRRFVILETGFGLGNNFLATWDAWRRDASACERLVFLSIERHPFRQDDLQALHRDSPLAPLAAQLVAAWPPLTPDLHHLSFESGRVVLMLCLGDVAAWLPALVTTVDAFFLDGFAPARNPQMWEPRLFKAIGRLAASGATAATWSSARAVRDGLQTAGFVATRAAGINGKREITTAHFAPAFQPRRAPSRLAAAGEGPREVLVIGAGLAGCATAWALAELGWRSTLLDRRDTIAAETSGNPGGLFHGIVNAQDGAHARFNRAAAMHAADAVRRAVEQRRVPGRVDGLLRLETSLPDVTAMRDVLDRIGLPPGYVQAIDADAASALCGLALSSPAWFYPEGGWVDPAALARSFVECAGESVVWRPGADVATLERVGEAWRALDADGRTIAEAPVVVLANAAGAQRLCPSLAVPLERVRGQISIDAKSRLPLPSRPIAGGGYLMGLPDGTAVFGATSQPGDGDANVRGADHHANLQRLAALLGLAVEDLPIDIAGLTGRTGWRLTTDDRLPLIGAVPLDDPEGDRHDRPRFVPRRPGLFVFTALGSRGITWSALGARCIAAMIDGSAVPLESNLLDAVDPARFVSRELRRIRSRASTTVSGPELG